MSRAKMTQLQTDIAVVQGWKDAAYAAREMNMVEFYDRLLAALKNGRAVSRSAPTGEPQP